MTRMLSVRPLSLLAGTAGALSALPVLAAAPGDVTTWLAQNTDLPASQVAIVQPDNVYSLEPLGSPSPTGEVVALVRTEAFASDWGASHGFQSWDATLLVDCAGARLRVIRSAAYPGRNRKGQPVQGAPDTDWTSPKAGEPSAQLVAAACDPKFAWPLRQKLATASAGRAPSAQGPVTDDGKPPIIVEMYTPKPPAAAPAADGGKPDGKPASAGEAKPAPAATATVKAAAPEAPPPEASGGRFELQIARGPSEAGAKKILAGARATLGPMANGLTDAVQMSEISGHRRRYSAVLRGFADAASADQACEALKKAKQDCVVRSAPAADAPAPAPSESRVAAKSGGGGSYFIQVTRGPSEDGARKALDKARKTLGPMADGLTVRMDTEDLNGKRRYTARLEGFATVEAADAACGRLARANQTCFSRPATSVRR